MVTLVEQYLDLHDKYSKLYGDKTAVLLQNGKFYETYALENRGPDIATIAEICNMQLTRRNKDGSPVTIGNPYMCGFQVDSFDRFVKYLLDEGYTLVIVVETGAQSSTGTQKERVVKEIISPSMTLTVDKKEGNTLMVIYMEDKAVGIATVDITTGFTTASQYCSTVNDPDLAYDETVRVVESVCPKEVLLINSLNPNLEFLINSYKPSITLHKKEINLHYSKIAYQNEVIKKGYPETGLLSPIEFVNLERCQIATIAFTYLLQFAYEHNNTIITKLYIPKNCSASYQLTLQYNSATQLNLISNNSNDKSLLNIINRCSTAMGSRLFKDRLLTPIYDNETLEHRWDSINTYISLDKQKLNFIRKKLNGVNDLERLNRKIVLNTIQPPDWLTISNSLNNLIEVFNNINRPELTNIVNSILNGFSILDLEECVKHLTTDINGTLFVKGSYKEVDELQETINNSLNSLNDIAKIITATGNSCKLDYQEKHAYFLSSTEKRFNTAIKHPEVSKLNLTSKRQTNSNVMITSDTINELSDIIVKTKNSLGVTVLELYKRFVSSFANRFYEEFKQLVLIVAEVDVTITNAVNAIEFGYTKPELVKNTTSFIDAKQLRHPIVERINLFSQYIPNDVTIGQMLLYGVNSAGKSSLMKAVGLNTIMAQAGMFVAATNFLFSPYHAIATRISSGDNIYRGQSSFVVEMTELRNILARADKNTLVLGDELCSGTEFVSGIAIVAAGVKTLVSKNASFIFATHLHDLTDYVNGVQIKHLHIKFDNDTIIYDRTLRDGSGSDIYGLEVCRALKLPEQFLTLANTIRNEYQNKDSLVKPKQSRYNSKLYVNNCSICDEPATEVHHITYQKEADSNGFVKLGVHKNHASNLVSLCEECHLKQHNGLLDIDGFSDTSSGRKLIVNHKLNSLDNHNTIKQREENVKQLYNTEEVENHPIVIGELKRYLSYGSKGWRMRITGKGRWVSLTEEGAIKILKLKEPLKWLEDNREHLLDYTT